MAAALQLGDMRRIRNTRRARRVANYTGPVPQFMLSGVGRTPLSNYRMVKAGFGTASEVAVGPMGFPKKTHATRMPKPFTSVPPMRSKSEAWKIVMENYPLVLKAIQFCSDIILFQRKLESRIRHVLILALVSRAGQALPE